MAENGLTTENEDDEGEFDRDHIVPLDDIKRYFSGDASSFEFAGTPPDSFIESDFFDVKLPDDFEIVQEYWTNEPFAYTIIVFDETAEKHQYLFFEPVLSDFEQYVRQDLEQTIRYALRDEDLMSISDTDRFRDTLQQLVAEHGGAVEDGSLHKIFYYLSRDFIEYGRLDPLMQDSHIEDISCNGEDRPVFVYHEDYRDLETNLEFTGDTLDSLVLSLAQRADKHLSISHPQDSGTLPDGSRIQLTYDSDISPHGSNFTIRKFQKIPFTPIDLIQFNTFSLDQMAYLWLTIENHMSIMFVGPTASGKTTSMNAVSLFLPPDAKIVSIEKVREISISHDNWVSYVSRNITGSEKREEISMYDLLQSALHARPEYMLVGEIRTDPVVVRTFFQSIFTGHPGGTTFHASSAQNAINRLTSDPLNITEQMVSAVDLMAVQQQVSIGEQGRRERRNLNISEIRRETESGDMLELVELFTWDPSADVIEQTIDSLYESRVMQEIADNRGWDQERLLSELQKRRRVLEYLIESDITDYDAVINAFYSFSRNEELVLDRIRTGEFDPSALTTAPL
jgi:flagellar protein FlaI